MSNKDKDKEREFERTRQRIRELAERTTANDARAAEAQRKAAEEAERQRRES